MGDNVSSQSVMSTSMPPSSLATRVVVTHRSRRLNPAVPDMVDQVKTCYANLTKCIEEFRDAIPELPDHNLLDPRESAGLRLSVVKVGHPVDKLSCRQKAKHHDYRLRSDRNYHLRCHRCGSTDPCVRGRAVQRLVFAGQ
jgi:hypothetical protein